MIDGPEYEILKYVERHAGCAPEQMHQALGNVLSHAEIGATIVELLRAGRLRPQTKVVALFVVPDADEPASEWSDDEAWRA